jgi:hypothetical protein
LWDGKVDFYRHAEIRDEQHRLTQLEAVLGG